MLRGAEKRMIVVRTRDSRMFEEAYFVVRPEADRGVKDETDMLWEANRILASQINGGKEDISLREDPSLPRFGLLQGLIWFTLGLFTGGGALGLLWFLLG